MQLWWKSNKYSSQLTFTNSCQRHYMDAKINDDNDHYDYFNDNDDHYDKSMMMLTIMTNRCAFFQKPVCIPCPAHHPRPLQQQIVKGKNYF